MHIINLFDITYVGNDLYNCELTHSVGASLSLFLCTLEDVEIMEEVPTDIMHDTKRNYIVNSNILKYRTWVTKYGFLTIKRENTDYIITSNFQNKIVNILSSNNFAYSLSIAGLDFDKKIKIYKNHMPILLMLYHNLYI
jgi:hypothetical protein